MIDINWNVADVRIVRGIHPSLNEEAVRAVKMLPKFSPAMLKGKAVRYSYTMPVSFILQKPMNDFHR